MKNEKVINNFLHGVVGQTALRDIQNGYFTYKGRTLSTDGDKLINYNTLIAYRDNDKIMLNGGKFSRTTSKIQSQIKRLASNYNLQVVEY